MKINRHTTNNKTNAWEINPFFILRRAGFPIELLLSCQFCQSFDRLSKIEFQAEIPGEIRNLFQSEINSAIATIKRISSTEKFKEMIFLSNPGSYAVLFKWIEENYSGNYDDRRKLLTIVMYLQRVTMKNDTTSFFGPFSWGKMDSTFSSSFCYKEEPAGKLDRTVFFSHWFIDDVVNSDELKPLIREFVVPRRIPTSTIEGNDAKVITPEKNWWLLNNHEQISYTGKKVWGMINGETPVDNLQQICQKEFNINKDEFDSALNELVNNKLITNKIEIPVGIADPLNYVRELTRGSQNQRVDYWFDRLQKWRIDFQKANLENREKLFAEISNIYYGLCQKESTRGSGEHYSDKTVFHEDGNKEVSLLQIGSGLYDELEKLEPVFDLFCLPFQQEYIYYQKRIANWFLSKFPGCQSVSMTTFLESFIRDQDQICIIVKETDDFRTTLEKDIFGKLIPLEAYTIEQHEINLDVIIEVLSKYPSKEGIGINPDILISAKSLSDINSGNYKLVLGEVHGVVDLLSHSPFNYALSKKDSKELVAFVSKRYQEILQNECLADLIRTHMRKTSTQLPTMEMEIEGAGLSQVERSKVLQLSELSVISDNEKLFLYSGKVQKKVRLTNMTLPNNGSIKYSPLRAFSLPQLDGPFPVPPHLNYCPRLTFGRTILSRQTWRIPAELVGSFMRQKYEGWSVEMYQNAICMMHALKLPQYIFVKIKGEPKPIFVDFKNYFLVHNFYKLWKKEKPCLEVTEALPSPDDLWLVDGNGHYSSEFRMGFYRKHEDYIKS